MRVNLRSAGLGRSFTSLLVTSAVAREGKTALACSLAAAFGLEGDRVLLVDGNLRQPTIGNFLGMHPISGLSAVLRGDHQPQGAIQSWSDGLFDVLTSGSAPENPSELLGSIGLMLSELESRYDVILIDSPALLPVADASVIARYCDSVLLVVRYGRTPASDVGDALAALRLVSARVLGCAFSMGPKSPATSASSAPKHKAKPRTSRDVRQDGNEIAQTSQRNPDLLDGDQVPEVT